MLAQMINAVHRHYQDLYMGVKRPNLLPVATLGYYESCIARDRSKIWKRKYWKSGVHESIFTVATEIEKELKRIDKYKEALSNGMTIWKEIAQDNT
jgi:hypothetical protein